MQQQYHTLNSIQDYERLIDENKYGVPLACIIDNTNEVKVINLSDTIPPFNAQSLCSSLTGESVTTYRDLQGIKSVGTTFQNQNVGNFLEFRFFTSITRIPDRAFASANIPEIILPESVEIIGKEAFSLGSLKEIELNEGLLMILPNAFNRCTELTNINLPSSLRYIGEYAFNYCRRLVDIKVNCSVPPYTPDSTFLSNCSLLQSIYVPAGCLQIYQSAIGWKEYAGKLKETTV